MFLDILIEFLNSESYSSVGVLLLTTGSGLGDDHKWIDKLCSRSGVTTIKMNPVIIQTLGSLHFTRMCCIGR